jgi:hypothetical protein
MRISAVLIVIILLALGVVMLAIAQFANGMSLPGMVAREYYEVHSVTALLLSLCGSCCRVLLRFRFVQGDFVEVRVNSLTSKFHLPFEFYSLPFCMPSMVTSSVESLGEMLGGDRVENSLYDLNFKVCAPRRRLDDSQLVQPTLLADERELSPRLFFFASDAVSAQFAAAQWQHGCRRTQDAWSKRIGTGFLWLSVFGFRLTSALRRSGTAVVQLSSFGFRLTSALRRSVSGFSFRGAPRGGGPL